MSEDGRAPVQRGGVSSGSGGAGVDSASSLMDFLKRESEKRDEQHQQLVGSMDTLRNTVVDLKNSIDIEKRTREKEIADVKTQIAGVEQRDKDIIAEMVKKEIAAFSSSGMRDEQDADREKQIIVTGFDERPEKVIVDGIRKELEKRDLHQRITSIFTFVEPSKVGVIEFETVAAKRGFFKKLRSRKIELDDGNSLYFNNNETWETRVKNKTLGQVKCKLYEEKKVALDAIKIDRRAWKVIIGGQVVASLDDEGNMTCSGIARDVKAGVETYMEEWKMKRSQASE